MTHQTVTLTGTYQLPNGTPAQGTIEIIPSEPKIIDDGGDVIFSGRAKVRLDDQGKFSVDLPATDDPSLNPTGFGYTVVAKLYHTHLPAVSFSLPAAVPVVDMTDVEQVDPSTFAPDANYVTDAELDAAIAGVEPDTSAIEADVTALDTRVATVEGEVAGKLDTSATDAQVATLAQDPASATSAALSATFATVDTPTTQQAFARLLGKLRGGVSAVWMNFGDSTSADPTDWPIFANQRVGRAFPTHTARYTQANATTWTTPAKATEGTTAATFTFANAAQGGWDSQDWIDALPTIAATYTPDVVTVVLGHNDPAATSEATYAALVDALLATFPGVPVVLCVQNPNSTNADQDTRRAYIHKIGATRGLAVSDAIWWAFGGPNPIMAFYLDNVHPTDAGVRAMTNAMFSTAGILPDESADVAGVSSVQASLDALVGGLGDQINPLSITSDYLAAYWAGDPAWTVPADGAAVASWRDGSGNGWHAVQATGTAQPLYRASVANLNGRPGVDFDGINDRLSVTGMDQYPTYTLIVVGEYTTAGRLFMGHASWNNGYGMGVNPTNGQWMLRSGVTIFGGTPTPNTPHLMVGVTNATAATSKMVVDGATVVTGDAGNDRVRQISLGAGGSATGAGWLDGTIGFAAVVPGDATAAGWWPMFETWVKSHYGVTIA